MVGETYKEIKKQFWIYFFVITATNLSVTIYSIAEKTRLTWENYVSITIKTCIATYIAMGILMYLFKGFSKKDWNPFSW